MNCPDCQHENPDDAQFCGACGSALAQEMVCARCGRSNPASQQFCHGCGNGLGEPSSAPNRDPRAYTPKHLADKILLSKSALEGERKQVTVLFADVKGSTELAERVDPEDWHQILDRFFQILADGVHRFEGTVNQYTGDGIMALFGAPIAHEDHAQRACYAALHLRDSLRRYADEIRLEHGLNLSTRMGMNSGDVVVGRIGDDLRMDYTAQGQVVHVAQRMEQLAESGRVYLTQATADRVAGYFRLREIGPARVKGVATAVGVHELEDVGEFTSRFDVSRARGLSKFVGREREMAVLEAALARAHAGKRQTVGIVAEAGTGKSRLTHEFVERCRTRDVQVFAAGSPPHRRSTPLGLIMDVQRSGFGIAERDSSEAARNKIAATLSRRDPRLVEFIPFMMEFLGVAEAGHAPRFVDPDDRQREFLRYIEATQEWRRREEQTMVVVLEDMHWADAASRTLIVEIERCQLRTPVLYVLNFRPEYRPPEADYPDYEEIRLKRLTPESTGELLRDLLGPEASGRGLEARVQDRAAGNPFFVEEMVQSLAESGTLEGQRGAYRIAQPIDTIEVPDSVIGILAARIDRVAERAKHVLYAAAVIGEELPVSLLADVTGLASRDIDAAVHDLARAEFVYQQAAYPEVVYAFKHPLTQEVAYDSQLRESRRRTHATVARLLEHRHADRLGEKAALVAHHWEQADELEQAARWHARAADWVGRTDGVQSVQHMQRVLALTARVPESSARDGLRLEACLRILVVGSWSYGLTRQEMDAIHTEGLALAERIGNASQTVDLHVGYGIAMGFAGDPQAYFDGARAAAALVDDSVSRDAVVNVISASGYSSYLLGRLPDALDCGQQVARLTEGDALVGTQNLSFSGWGWSAWMRAKASTTLGRLAEARTLFHEALTLMRAHEMRPTLIWTLTLPVELADWSGNVGPGPEADEARQYVDEAVRLAEQHGGHFMRSFTAHWHAVAHLLFGEWAQAADELEAAVRAAHAQQNGLEREADMLAYLARAHLGGGDAARARTTAAEAIACAERQGARFFECRAQLVQAQALRAEAGFSAQDAIAACLARALALVEETGGRVLEPQIIEERARLAALRSDDGAAAEDLRRAHALYVEIGATGHAERVAKELGL